MIRTLRTVAGERIVTRLSRGLPIVQVWTAGRLALLAGHHVGYLTADERRRLAGLVARGRGRPSALGDADADELRRLVAKLQLRLFAGTAVARLSPVPLPKRLLYGPRGHPARLAASR